MTRIPAWRHTAARRLMRSRTASPSSAAGQSPCTNRFCVSTLMSAARSGTTVKSTMRHLLLRPVGDTRRRRPVGGREQQLPVVDDLLGSRSVIVGGTGGLTNLHGVLRLAGTVPPPPGIP